MEVEIPTSYRQNIQDTASFRMKSSDKAENKKSVKSGECLKTNAPNQEINGMNA